MNDTSVAYRKKIALVAGGDSGEYVISVKSAEMISRSIDPQRFEVHTIMVRKGHWEHVSPSGVKTPVNRHDFSVSLSGDVLRFDCAFITIHGTPGEDGRLQAYFDLIGLPYTTAGMLSSALTSSKYYCNLIARQLGFKVANSVLLRKGCSLEARDLDLLLAKTALPVFVKPNNGGSSLGTHFVSDVSALGAAIQDAFQHDTEVLVEAFIRGMELSCGVFSRQGGLHVLPVTAIISRTSAGFFDFKAKYTRGGADEITPAPISDALTREVQKTTADLFRAYGMKGLARIDFIAADDGLYFLEINVTPGMADTSIVPQQAAADGIPVMELFSILIDEALAHSKSHVAFQAP